MRTSMFLIMTAWSLGLAAKGSAFECTVCHSRNPAMVRMHDATKARGIGCFDCHRVGEKLMGEARQKDRASLLGRRISESPCLECHGKEAKR